MEEGTDSSASPPPSLLLYSRHHTPVRSAACFARRTPPSAEPHNTSFCCVSCRRDNSPRPPLGTAARTVLRDRFPGNCGDIRRVDVHKSSRTRTSLASPLRKRHSIGTVAMTCHRNTASSPSACRGRKVRDDRTREDTDASTSFVPDTSSDKSHMAFPIRGREASNADSSFYPSTYMVFAGEKTPTRLVTERRRILVAAAHGNKRVPTFASLLHHLMTWRTRAVSVADGFAQMSTRQLLPAWKNALGTIPWVAAMLLNVFVVTVRRFPARLRTRRIQRASELLARDIHRRCSTFTSNRDLQRTRRTFARVTRQQTHMSSTRERLIADLPMRSLR